MVSKKTFPQGCLKQEVARNTWLSRAVSDIISVLSTVSAVCLLENDRKWRSEKEVGLLMVLKGRGHGVKCPLLVGKMTS